MKKQKIVITVSIVLLLFVSLFGYFTFSYKKNLNNFSQALEKDDFNSASTTYKDGINNAILKKSFNESCNEVILNKLSSIKNEYNSGKLSEEKTLEELNGLLSINSANKEVKEFMETLPTIKMSKKAYDNGISLLKNGNPTEALNKFRSVSVLSDLKTDAVKQEKECLLEIKNPLLKKVDEYIANKKYSKGIEYLNTALKNSPEDSLLKSKKEELEKLRLTHLENYSKENIEKATAKTAPVIAYYNKITPEKINTLDISSETNHLVFVNIQDQKTYVYKGSKNNWKLEKTLISSTGIEGKETPVGVFKVQNRAPWFFSPKYGQGGKYYVQFMGNYLFHSIPFDSDKTTVSDPTLGEPASHGCIRLAVDDAKWLYDNVQNGSKIIIY